MSESGESQIKIEQSQLMCPGQNAQRAGYEEMAALGFGSAIPIVDQKAVGVHQKRKGKGRALARVEEGKTRVEGRVRMKLQSCGRVTDPLGDRRRRPCPS